MITILIKFVSKIEFLESMKRHQNATHASIAPHSLTPLGLLTLAACGGGGGSSPSVSSSGSSTVSGNAVAGPIDGAVAFVDYDEDGVLDIADEPYAYTGSDGGFSLTSTDADAPIVVTTDSALLGAYQ